ncbi:MAG: GTPase ObgE, partial [Phycisphaerales bacterium]|nr:GTPase ObgE [Phycisphaerales bacterium]
GGPDGGTGGHVGDVIAEATHGVDTLLDFSSRYHWIAESGRPGGGSECSGKNGSDVVLRLPVGTMIYDRDTGVLLKDLTEVGERACIAEGGKYGRGNRSFASATNRTPREAEPGEPGQERWLRLELKLIADVGLVGLPNAGKSTLLSAVSRAKAKIGAYPFTTTKPQLGIVELSGYRRLVLADIPGLIAGAHEGAGLGDEFLRHIERTRVIAHLLDVSPPEGSPSPVEAYHTIREELNKFSPQLAAKAEVVVATKMDLSGAGDAVEALRASLSSDVVPISAATRSGLEPMLERLWRMVDAAREADRQATADSPPDPPVQVG